MNPRTTIQDIATMQLTQLINEDFSPAKIKIPLKNGANPNIVNKNGDSILHILVNNLDGITDVEYLSYIVLLLEDYHAEINIRNKRKLTPYQCLISQKFDISVAMYLINRGASINEVNVDGDSLLQLVVKNKVPSVPNYTNTILDLIKYGANINQNIRNNFSAFDFLQAFTKSSDVCINIALGFPVNFKKDKNFIPHNQFTIDTEINSNKTATVHKGTYKGHTIAIKTMTYDFKTLEFHNKETEIMKNLNQLKSNYFVNYFGYSMHLRKYHIVMEYLPSGDLRDFISNYSNIEWSTRIEFMYHISNAVKFMHDINILHRDLKPENILIDDSEYKIKLCDFGHATFISNKCELAGTPGYIAPEHLSSNPIPHHKPSDIYSLGTIFWETAHIETAYNNLEDFTIIEKNLSDIQENIHADCLPPVAALIKNCWLKEHANRHTAQEIATKFTALRQKL